jgi:hypothetical protein
MQTAPAIIAQNPNGMASSIAHRQMQDQLFRSGDLPDELVRLIYD